MTSIRILDPEQWQIDAYGIDGGKVYLDIDGEFNIRLTKSLEEMTEAEKIAREASLSSSIPATAKNTALLAQYSENLWKRKNKAFSQRVEVKKDGEQLNATRLTVSGKSDREQQYEIELFGGGWIDDLERKLVSSLDLGTFNYSEANARDAWDDQTAPAVPALADYGGFWDPGRVTRKDLRFWFNLKNLIEQAFCQATEYTFKSPYLESTAGQSLYTYISPENWHSYREKNDIHRVFLEIAAPKSFGGNPESNIWDEVYDPLGLWDESPTHLNEYLYPPSGAEELEIEFEIRGLKAILPPSGAPGRFYFLVYKNEPGGSGFEVVWSTTADGSTTETTTVEINEKFRLPADNNGDRFGMITGYEDPTFGAPNTFYPFTIESGELFIRPDPPYYIEDDTITLADLIDPTINCLELFRAALHIFNGKISTDESEKTVTAYPPFDAEQLGQAIEGYFQRNIGHQALTVEDDSMVTENKEADTDRYVKLMFKKSTDEYIGELDRQDIYSRTVDLGYGKAETKEIENNLFEPTAERFVGPERVGGNGIYLPVLTDNLIPDGEIDGERSTKIGPRIGWHYGEIRQEDAEGQRSYQFGGSTTQSFGYITQNPIVPRVNASPNVPIVFAEHENDLWRLFYRQWLTERYALVDFEFLVYLSLRDYLQTDFRRPAGFQYGETFLLFQIREIRDFDTEAETATPIKMTLLEC